MVITEQGAIATAYRFCDVTQCPDDPNNAAVVSALSITGALAGSDFLQVPVTEKPVLPSFVAVAGGVVSSFADGTMGGPDAAFQQMSLSKAQHLDGNAWIGRRNAALEQVHGPFVGEPNSPWFMAQGNAQAPNSATATAPSAQVICRRIFLPLGLFGDHCYIVVRQTNEPTTYIEVRRGSGDGGLNVAYYTTESDPANENVRLAHRGYLEQSRPR